MYLFKPKKKYDPTPFNWFLHQLHGIIGCRIKTLKGVKMRGKSYWFSCNCGRMVEVYREQE